MSVRNLALFLSICSSILACGDDGTSGSGGGGGSASSCAEDPFTCPAGQVCWIANAGKEFKCLNAGAASEGEACINYIDAPSCGEGLACLQLQDEDSGFCSPYCSTEDPAHACPEGRNCLNLNVNGIITHVCSISEGTGGGGAGGSGGGSAGGAGGTSSSSSSTASVGGGGGQGGN